MVQYIKICISITEKNSAFLERVAEDFQTQTGMGFKVSRYIQELLNEKEAEFHGVRAD